MEELDLFLDDNGRFIIDLKITGKGKNTRVIWDKPTLKNALRKKSKTR